jgi:hypothetical protein
VAEVQKKHHHESTKARKHEKELMVFTVSAISTT